MLTFDKDFSKKLNTVLVNFLWKGKDKIKRRALVSDYSDGGLKMPHLESTIKTQRIMCLKKFIENYHSPWKLISKITWINSFFIAIMTLLTYLNPSQSFIASVLKLGLHLSRNNHFRATTLWNTLYRYFGVISTFESMTNLNFAKSHLWLESQELRTSSSRTEN